MLDLGLKGKVAIVTGGSDGLGRATVSRLAAEGAKVIACARREDHLMHTVEQLKQETGGAIIPVCLLYTSPSPRDRG